MPKKVQKARDLKGLFIYQDEHYGTVFFDIFTRNGYILTSKDTKWYTLSITFLPVAIIIFYFSVYFKFSYLIAGIAAIVFYTGASFLYRFLFLYKLPCVENYSISKRKSLVENLTKTYSKQRLIVVAIFLVALVGTMSAYILTSDFTGIIFYALWVIVGFITAFLIIVIIALSRKK